MTSFADVTSNIPLQQLKVITFWETKDLLKAYALSSPQRLHSAGERDRDFAGEGLLAGERFLTGERDLDLDGDRCAGGDLLGGGERDLLLEGERLLGDLLRDLDGDLE